MQTAIIGLAISGWTVPEDRVAKYRVYVSGEKEG